jgi:hypothetical protein
MYPLLSELQADLPRHAKHIVRWLAAPDKADIADREGERLPCVPERAL